MDLANTPSDSGDEGSLQKRKMRFAFESVREDSWRATSVRPSIHSFVYDFTGPKIRYESRRVGHTLQVTGKSFGTTTRRIDEKSVLALSLYVVVVVLVVANCGSRCLYQVAVEKELLCHQRFSGASKKLQVRSFVLWIKF